MVSKIILVLAVCAFMCNGVRAQASLIETSGFTQDELKELIRPITSPKIHPNVKQVSKEKIKVWILFRDKGIFSLDHYQKALIQAEANLTERARKRRLKSKKQEDIVDFKDLPVKAEYTKIVLDFGVKHRATSRWLNAISVEATYQQIVQIAELSFVAHIKPVASFRRIEPAPIKAPSGLRGDTLDYGPSFWQLDQLNVPAAHELGYNGTGVLICMLDTGFERTHEALVDVTVVAEWDFIHDDDDTSYDPLQDDPNQPFHGTVTLSAVGGFEEGHLIGPAYGAEFALGKTEEVTFEQPIEEDWWVEGIEWADSLGADIVSSSLGYSDWYTYEDMNGDSCVTTIGADVAASRGIIVCNAMGNRGQWPGSIIAPADADSIISVGAVNLSGNLASFSSIGPTYDGRTKPEVVALGVNTYAADPGDDNGYIYIGGTSLSTPLVAGFAAILVHAHPDWTNMEVRQAMMMTADQADNPDNYYGWGIPDALAALDYDPGVEEFQGPALYLHYLAPNYPNPFSSFTTIEFSLSFSTYVSVAIYDISGALVDILVSDVVSVGQHCVVWDRTDHRGHRVSSGVYFYCLSTGNHTETRQMIIVQ